MKVLNLQCDGQHVFEGWFASEDDYASQLTRGLLACPMCGCTSVSKLPSAPRLNLGAEQPAPAPAPGTATPTGEVSSIQALQAAWLQMARHLVTHTEDVGLRFAEEARRIHHGDVPERGIRGQASPEETQALLEEGIAILPLPEVLKEPLQ